MTETTIEAAPETYAFRCRTCNTLEAAAAAGENAVPAACRTCGAGVHWEMTGAGAPVKAFDPDNWIVLAEIAPDELAPILEYHQISEADVVTHTPPGSEPREPQVLDRSVTEGVLSEDTTR